MPQRETISPELLSYLHCPECQNGALIEQDQGTIGCSHCNSLYPVTHGVPDFAPADEQHGGFDYQWRKRAENKFEKDEIYGKTPQEMYKQFFEYLKIKPTDLKNKKILDAGTGSGTLLSALKKHSEADFCSIDISHNIYRLAERFGERNLSWIKGDLLKPPLKPAAFDYIWSMGVIHHTGDTTKAFKNIANLVKPGGRLYVWVYSVSRSMYMNIRRYFPLSHKLSYPLLHWICRLIALPIYCGAISTFKHRPYNRIVFKLFDHLNPKYTTLHSDEEVRRWFENSGFEHIEIIQHQDTGGVGVMGVRK